MFIGYRKFRIRRLGIAFGNGGAIVNARIAEEIAPRAVEVERGLENTEQRGRNYPVILCAGLAIYTIVRGILQARTQTLGNDEILTDLVARQHSLADIYHALLRGLDGQPVLFYVVEHAALGLVQNIHIALRLPSILAMACTIAAVFVYAKRVSGEWVALSCSLLLVSTKLFQGYTTDARPYSLLVACLALALICHQRLPSLRWAGGMALALTLGQAFHYYAIFGVLAFAAAELALLVFRRRFRWYAWLGFAVSGVPLVLSWRLLAGLKSYYGAHFWSHYSAGDIPLTYADMLMTTRAVGLAFVVLCIGVAATVLVGRRGEKQTESNEDFRLGEDASFTQAMLMICLALLPVTTFVLLKFAHTATSHRYAYPTLLGFAGAVALMFRGANPRNLKLLALFVVALSGLHEYGFWRELPGNLPDYSATAKTLVQAAGEPSLPIVVSSGMEFVRQMYYAPTVLKERLIYLADPQRAVEFTQMDSHDRGILVVRDYLPVRVEKPEEFFAQHDTFLMYSIDNPEDIDWLPLFLGTTGASMRLLGQQENARIYLVKWKEPGARRSDQ